MTETVQDVFDELWNRYKLACSDFELDIGQGCPRGPRGLSGDDITIRQRFSKALKAETEAQRSCPYCHDPAEDDPASNLSDVIGTRMMIITHGTGAPYITTWDFDGAESKQISFCPMCGRQLEGKE